MPLNFKQILLFALAFLLLTACGDDYAQEVDNIADGDATDGDVVDGDTSDGDTTDGDVTDGDNDSASMEIKADEGGTVALADLAKVVIPPGALAEDTVITITKTDDDAPGDEHGSAIFDFAPDGLKFNIPVILSIRQTNPSPAGKTPALGTKVNGEWHTLEMVNFEGVEVSGAIEHFSPWTTIFVDDQTACEGCLIDDTCYKNGMRHPDLPCAVCDSEQKGDGWSIDVSGTSCRASAGICDLEEVCDGSNGLDCPEDAFQADDFECRAVAGACDVAETCDGQSAACPSNQFHTTETECRASAGECDAAESCTGYSPLCPDDAKLGAATTCRESAGACDVAETCDGLSDTCPDDTLLPATTICRAEAGVCDLQELCTGSSPECPGDNKHGSETMCRAAAGFCDIAETCSGDSNDCPTDAYAPDTLECRAKTGDCDVAEMCSGSGPNCPADTVAVSTVVCREAAGVCDVAETCDGGNKACPDDLKLSSTSVCRAKDGFCDVAETCDGVNNTCPADLVANSTVECRGAAGDCDAADFCDGAGKTCPTDAKLDSSTVCRASEGICDVAENCTGDSDDCPVDGFAAGTVECRSAQGDCDTEEFCSGDSPYCPADQKLDADTVCREAEGLCDVEETCTGYTDDCPTDLFKWPTEVCNAATDLCDVPEYCTGLSGDCPTTDAVADDGTVCRETAGVCDAEEVCDGEAKACPSDDKKSATVCRAAAGICDVAEQCNGTDDDCPADALATAATMCRPAAVICDASEFCAGDSPYCPADQFASVGTGCNDGNNCTAGDVCDGQGAGTMHCSGTLYSCNDAGTCNTADDVCTCITGYTGDYCDSCDTDYQDNDGDGICSAACSHSGACTTPLLCSDTTGTASCDICQSGSGIVKIGSFGGTARAEIQVIGDYAYTAFHRGGVKVFDVSDPAAPTVVTGFDTDGYAQDFALNGNTLYVADGPNGLLAYDVTDPTQPQFLAHQSMAGNALDLAYDNDRLYVAADWGGLLIFNVPTPTQFILEGSHLLEGEVETVTAKGGLALLGYFNPYNPPPFSMILVDVSTPSDSMPSWSYEPWSGPIRDIFLSGTTAYLGCGNTLELVDVSSPDSPANIKFFAKGTWDDVHSVSVVGDAAYVAGDANSNVGGYGFFDILDISDINNFQTIGSTIIDDTAYQFALVDNQAFVSAGGSGVNIVDFSAPTDPEVVGRYTSFGDVNDVLPHGGYAYVLEDTRGLGIWDLSDPNLPVEVGRYSTDLIDAHVLAIKGNYAYIVDEVQGLVVVDISDPTAPTYVNNLFFGYDFWGTDIDIKDNYAFITGEDLGLLVVDISDPANPVVVDYFDADVALAVELKKNVVYVADPINGLWILDIGMPGDMFVIDLYDFFSTPLNFVLDADAHYGYLATTDGLAVLDVSSPSEPTLMGFVGTEFIADRLFIEGNRLYASGDSGDLEFLLVADISDPMNPVILDTYFDGDNFETLFADNGFVYVTNDYTGISTLDASQAGANGTPGSAIFDGVRTGLAITENVAYQSVDETGFHALDITDTQNPSWLSYTPDAWNPFVLGNSLWAVDGISDLIHHFNIDDPTTPVPVNTCGMASPQIAVAYDNRLAVVDYSASLVLFADQNFTVCDSTTTTLPYANPRTLVVSDQTAYICYDSKPRVSIFDVSGPVAALETNLELGLDCNDAFVHDGLLYVGLDDHMSTTGALAIYDVSDPSDPTLISQTGMPTDVSSIFLQGSTLFVGFESGGIAAVNVSDPENPFIFNTYPSWGPVVDLCAYGSVLASAEENTNMNVHETAPCPCPDGHSYVNGECLESGQPDQAGDLVITELFSDVGHRGEWLEIHNPTASLLELEGCVLKDDGSDTYTFDKFAIPAGEYAIVATGGNVFETMGVMADYWLAEFQLDQTGDEVEIVCGATTIDRITYTDVQLELDDSIQLNANHIDQTENDLMENWCVNDSNIYSRFAPIPRYGTPGEANDGCGVWFDPATALEWEVFPSTSYYTNPEAVTYCDNLSLEGGSWRVPTIDELRTLVRDCSYTETGGACGVTDACTASLTCFDLTDCVLNSQNNCAIGAGQAYNGCYWPIHLQGECDPKSHWSQTGTTGLPNGYWYVRFKQATLTGEPSIGDGGVPLFVRCVRDTVP